MIALGQDEALATNGLGVTAIAARTESEKSQVSRACSVLADVGLIERDAVTRRYRLGWRLFALAARAGEIKLLDAAPSALDELVAALAETAHLSVRQGTRALTLLSRSPRWSVTANGWAGRTVPLTCTSSGRALLLDHGRPELAVLLDEADFGRYGPGAPRDLDQLNARITAARAKGWAVADEEFELGLVAAAAPIRDFTGAIIAAVNISGPKFRLGARLDEAGRTVSAVADSLSAVLGAPGRD